MVDQQVNQKLATDIPEGGAWTAIVAPGGEVLAGPLPAGQEGIVYAEIDLEKGVQHYFVNDSTDHYWPKQFRVLVITDLTQRVWGTEPISLNIPAKIYDSGFVSFGTKITFVQLGICITSVALMILLTTVVRRSKTGRFIRTVEEDLTASSLLGINSRIVYPAGIFYFVSPGGNCRDDVCPSHQRGKFKHWIGVWHQGLSRHGHRGSW